MPSYAFFTFTSLVVGWGLKSLRVCQKCVVDIKPSPPISFLPNWIRITIMENSQRGTLFLLIAGGLLVIVATVLILIPRQDPRTAAPPEIENAPPQADIPFPEVPRISVEDTKAQFDANSAIIVDVRSPDAYASSHIPNSLSIPEEELEARVDELPKDAEILLYCT